MPNIQENFVNNIKYYLNLRGKTQTELANYIGVAKTTVSSYMTGNSMPRMDKIDKICQFLYIKRSDLLENKKGNANEEEILLLARDIKTLNREQQEIIISMINQFRSN